MIEGLQVKTDKKKYNSKYRGEVVDNNDPSKLGRIKVRVYPMFADLDVEFIPWARPCFPLYTGAGVGYGTVNIPDNGTMVWCEFEAGNIRQPIYVGEANDGKRGQPTEKDTNYPARRVTKTKSGFIIYIDDTSNECRVQHPKGSYINMTNEPRIRINHPTGSYELMDENGDVTVVAARDIIATAERNITATAKLGDITCTAEKGNASVWAFGNISLTALVNIALNALGTISVIAQNIAGGGGGTSSITIDGDIDINVNGNVDADVDGDVDLATTGSAKISSGGPVTIEGSTVSINP